MNVEEVEEFKSFQKYDFDSDEQFKSGISSLLNNQQDNETEIINRAKLFYYTKFIKSFNVEEYKKWKEQEITEVKEDKIKLEDKPPRFTFQELVDMIEKGIEIPGIKQIPNKLNEGTPSESKMTARLKPWEIKK